MEELSTDYLFHRAFENAAIGMALVSPDGRWLKVNRSVCDIVGYSEQELLSKTFQEITHADDLDLDLAFMGQLARAEIPHYHMEKRYLHRAGHLIWIHLSVSVVRREDSTPRFYISQIEDISARKALEFQLRVAIEERERLIKELESSARQNRELRDQLVTICAWTNRIFHDGRWMSADEFLASYLGLHLTHGMSDEGRALFLAESQRLMQAQPPRDKPK